MESWSNSVTLNFLECYQGESIIWDPQHNNHKDKKKVADAWDRLALRLNIPVKELKNKRDILMGSFRRHLKKKQESIRSGAGSDDVYEPIWFAYAVMESFLLPVFTTRPSINTEMEQSTSQVAQESFGDETNTSEGIESVLSSISQEESQSTVTTSARKSRRRFTPDPAEQQMATAFSQLTNAISHRQSQPTPSIDDECDLYAKLLATKLRDFSKDERKLIMYDIDGIFIQRIHNRLSECHTSSPQSPYSMPSSASTPYSRPPSASTPYSRPPTASTSHSRSDLNLHIPNQPSTAINSYSEPYSEPITNRHNKPILKKNLIYLERKPLSVLSSNTLPASLKILPPSSRISHTYSIQRTSVTSPSIQSPDTNSLQPQPPPIESPDTNSLQPQPPPIQSPDL